MNETIAKQLDELQRKIEAGDFIRDAQTVSEWGGADVIISSRLSQDVEKWLGDGHLVISLQDTEPRRRAVITACSKELSWLFYRLRDIFVGTIDFMSKYDFYGRLAQSAIDYIEANKECSECTHLLKTVLDEAKRMSSI